jgi:hypothetical protein
MGTSAETAIVDYRLSFADQGKKTSVFRFLFRCLLIRFTYYNQRHNSVPVSSKMSILEF